MTLAELIVALRSGDASPAAQRLAADLLQLRRLGRPAKPYWQRAGALIDRIERLTADEGSRKRAFAVLAAEASAKGRRQNAATVKRYYRTAKRWEKAELEWIETVFSELTEGDEKQAEESPSTA